MSFSQEKYALKNINNSGGKKDVPPLVTYSENNNNTKSILNRNQLLQQARNHQHLQNIQNQTKVTPTTTPTFNANKSPPNIAKPAYKNQ